MRRGAVGSWLGFSWGWLGLGKTEALTGLSAVKLRLCNAACISDPQQVKRADFDGPVGGQTCMDCCRMHQRPLACKHTRLDRSAGSQTCIDNAPSTDRQHNNRHTHSDCPVHGHGCVDQMRHAATTNSTTTTPALMVLLAVQHALTNAACCDNQQHNNHTHLDGPVGGETCIDQDGPV